MKIFHKFFICVVLFLMIFNATVINAHESEYVIYDAASDFSTTFDSYSQALTFFKQNKDDYENLILKQDDKVLHMEYGVVEFKINEACSLNIDYHSLSRNTDEYLNGCYGIDGAYLYTDDKAERVYYLLSNEKAYTDVDNVILHPYEEIHTTLSSYTNKDGRLFHNIKAQFDQDYYSYSIDLDKALPYLSNNEYYSYDGHYFYDDFKLMIDDYNYEIYDNSINDEPYYNYYQYLPHRSLSNYTVKQIEDYFYETLKIDGKLRHYTDLNFDGAADEINRSQLYKEIDEFFINQYMYGTNAMMLISSAINESAYGRSLNSFLSNNLYTVAAYENQNESDNNSYATVAKSIYSHSKYIISSLYSNYRRSNYYGTFYGDKYAGINTSYSLDPYYGQKCAATYSELDQNNGLKDYNSLAVGIIKNKKSVNLYRDEDLKNRYIILNDINELSFVILDENDNSYKIQTDSSNLDDYLYSFKDCIAYVSKDDFDYILNENKIHEYSLKELNYDFLDGEYNSYNTLQVFILENEDILNIDANKNSYVLKDYDENLIAQYKQIKNIEIINDFDSVFELYQNIDLKDSVLRIYYDDSSYEDIEINSEMLGTYDNTITDSQTLNITFNGLSIEKNIRFDEDLYNHRLKLKQALEQNEYSKVKNELAFIKYPLTFSQIRNTDYELKQLNNRNYVIDDKTEKYNMSISGLDLSLEDRHVFNFVGDTYYVIINNIGSEDEEKIYELSKGYGFEKQEGLDISFRFNYQDIELIGPAIVQIDLTEKKSNYLYTVYHLSDNGDIIKCRTTQSENYIQFMIDESGPYLVLSRPSVNEYDLRDNTEDLSYENMGFDNHRINFSLMAILTFTILGLIGITTYYIFYNKRRKMWKDFRRSLRIAGFVQEEKLKS